MAEILEGIMLLCFGASWPVSVYKSWTSRSTKGKSIFFLLLIETGYIVGLIGKLLFSPSYVIAVYCLNILFVATDTLLFLKNRRYEKGLASDVS